MKKLRKFWPLTLLKDYAVHRLPFGISVAPGIFQRLMEGLLAGIDRVAVLIAYILITGKTKEEHDSRLKNVLDIFYEYGLKIKKKKSRLYAPLAEFLGYRIDSGAHIH